MVANRLFFCLHESQSGIGFGIRHAISFLKQSDVIPFKFAPQWFVKTIAGKLIREFYRFIIG